MILPLTISLAFVNFSFQRQNPRQMKNLSSLFFLSLCFYGTSFAQLVCVHCFNQNAAVSPGATNLILNGGFENTNCVPGWLEDVFCPNSTKYSCDLENWQCTGGDELSYPSVFDSSLSIIPEGLNAAYFGNGNAFTCSEQWGDTACFVYHNCVITGIPAGYPRANPGYGEQTGVSIEQNIPNLTIGQTYVLEFWAGGEPLLGLLTAPAIFSVDVGFGNTYLLCQPTGEPGNTIGTRFLVIFDAISNDHIIKFTNWGHTCADCTELVIDDVNLYTLEELSPLVPECTTSTEDINEHDGYSVNPNPFNDELIIHSNLSDLSVITLYDIASQVIVRQVFTNTIGLNTSRLTPGIYFYRINSGYNTRSGKLIKG